MGTDPYGLDCSIVRLFDCSDCSIVRIVRRWASWGQAPMVWIVRLFRLFDCSEMGVVGTDPGGWDGFWDGEISAWDRSRTVVSRRPSCGVRARARGAGMACTVDLAPEGAVVLLRVEVERVLLELLEEGLRGWFICGRGEHVTVGDEAFSDFSVHRVLV